MEDMEPGKEEAESPHAFLVASHYCCPHLAVEARDQGPPLLVPTEVSLGVERDRKRLGVEHSGFTDLAMLCISQEFGRALNKLH